MITKINQKWRKLLKLWRNFHLILVCQWWISKLKVKWTTTRACFYHKTINNHQVHLKWLRHAEKPTVSCDLDLGNDLEFDWRFSRHKRVLATSFDGNFKFTVGILIRKEFWKFEYLNFNVFSFKKWSKCQRKTFFLSLIWKTWF